MQSKSVIVTCSIAVFALACGGGTDGPAVSTQSSELNASPFAPAVVPNLTPQPTFSDSTVPVSGAGAGDVNPYGVAFVPRGFPAGGLLRAGDVIVANFNDLTNAQGTGTTIVRVNANADPSVFFRSKLPGLSTALGVLRSGYVLVGNLPSTGTGDQRGVCTPGPDGEEEGVGQGALQVINRNGQLVETLMNKRFLDGPWDLTVKDEGARALVFVSNALTGTVTRLDLLISGDGDGDGDDHVVVASATQIASGYVHRCDPAAFVVAPTGVALDEERDLLYVASAGDNKIFAIPDASVSGRDFGRGRLVVDDPTHLHGPLGLALAPNGDLVSAQGDAVNPNPDPNGQSEIVEFTPGGRFVAEISVEPTNAGAAFGLAVEPLGVGFRFAAVDDFANTLDLWVVR
jgi:hypothetical protein